MLSTSQIFIPGRSAKTRIFPAYPHFIPVFQFLLVFIHSSLKCAAHNYLKLTDMKTNSKSRKTFLDEFTDYFEALYEPEEDYETISDELLNWEYERFLEMIAD